MKSFQHFTMETNRTGKVFGTVELFEEILYFTSAKTCFDARLVSKHFYNVIQGIIEKKRKLEEIWIKRIILSPLESATLSHFIWNICRQSKDVTYSSIFDEFNSQWKIDRQEFGIERSYYMTTLHYFLGIPMHERQKNFWIWFTRSGHLEKFLHWRETNSVNIICDRAMKREYELHHQTVIIE